ncbi:MAG: hypothetical protein J7575_09125, partial [Chloroflexi bacterium]|nr:hypothetical protein [Chloroflexota bacterium]
SRGWPWGALACGGTAALGLALGLSRPAAWRTARDEQPVGGQPQGLPPQAPALHFLALWLTVPLLVIWLISLRQPLFTDRYLIWCAPAFYLLAGQGWAVLKKTTKTRRHEGKNFFNFVSWCLCGLIFLIFALNLHAQATVPIKSDVRAAAAYVEARYQPGDLLIFQIPHIRYTFDYYFGPTDYLWADGLYTNHRAEGGTYRLSEEAAGRWMALIVGNRARVWLVASEVEMWDERNLVQGWLERTFVRADEAHFTRIGVYGYRR